MPKITFLVDHTPKGQAPDRPTYKAGETHDLEQSYADKYVLRGLAKPFDPKAERERKDREAAERKAHDDAAKLAARAAVVIPDNLPFEFAALRDLAQSLTDDVVKSRDDAMKAIEAEKARRAALG